MSRKQNGTQNKLKRKEEQVRWWLVKVWWWSIIKSWWRRSIIIWRRVVMRRRSIPTSRHHAWTIPWKIIASPTSSLLERCWKKKTLKDDDKERVKLSGETTNSFNIDRCNRKSKKQGGTRTRFSIRRSIRGLRSVIVLSILASP